MKAAFIRYGAAFFAGAFAMWLWHNANINRIEKSRAEEKAEQAQQVAQTAVKDAKDAGENSGTYLEALNSKDAEIADLRRQLGDGSVRLRLCGAEAATAGVQAHNSRAVTDEAGTDLARYREDAIHLYERALAVDAWVTACHAWVNR